MTVEKNFDKELTPEQYRVLREHGTERAGTSPLNHEKRAGRYFCAGCGQELFDSATKYDSGSGWPSFYAPKDGAVATTVDTSHGMRRDEVQCANCGGHLGHVFAGEGLTAKNTRHCVNSVSMKFYPKGKERPAVIK